jgi:hypothetical protein
MAALYTIGHSNRSPDAFVERHKVTAFARAVEGRIVYETSAQTSFADDAM